MVRLSDYLAASILLVIGIFFSTTVRAQQDLAGYNEESAGVLDYSDAEAAGTAPLADDEDPDAVVSDESDAQTESDGVIDAEMATAAEVDETGSVDVSTTDAAEAGGVAEQQKDDELPVDAAAIDTDFEAGNVFDDVKGRENRMDWEWGAMRYHTGWASSAGLMDIKLAGSNAPGTLSMGIFAGYFKYSDYLIKGDVNTAMAGTLNFRATVWKYLELHTAIHTYANHNTAEYPRLFQTIGDIQIGAKGFYSFNKLITAALDLHFNILNAVGSVGMRWSGTSVGIDSLATFDFTSISEQVPVRAHLMLGYIFDNSYKISEDVEAAGGGCGSDLDNDGEVEYTGCLSPVERTALGIDRNDQVHLGVGFDGLLPYVSPILEWHLDIPVNRQGFTCPQIPGSYDACMADAGAKGMRQWLNIGVRGLPPVKGLAIDFGVEVGLAGYAPSVHELAAQEPYMIKFGLSYQLNPFEKPPKCEPVEKVAAATPPPEEVVRGAQIVGMVHDSESIESPIGDAVVVYDGLELNPQVTSAAGRFNSYELPAGDVALVVSAPNYEEQQFVVTVPESGFVEQLFPLVRKPMKGVVTVRLVDDKGEPVPEMEVYVSGTMEGTFTSDAEGQVMLEADAGTLTFIVSNDAYMHKQISVELKPDTHEKATMELKKKGKQALAEVKKDRIRIRRKIHFRTNSDVINENSFSLLDEVADILLKNPQIQKVEIQGHTDDRGNRDHNVELSQKRAESVREYLIRAGVSGDRLDAKGFGPNRPIAPNVIDTGRAKNRRVEFHILQAE
jgi:outer membrane protein OmpA-like peptidoglycan-associated protein